MQLMNVKENLTVNSSEEDLQNITAGKFSFDNHKVHLHAISFTYDCTYCNLDFLTRV